MKKYLILLFSAYLNGQNPTAVPISGPATSAPRVAVPATASAQTIQFGQAQGTTTVVTPPPGTATVIPGTTRTTELQTNPAAAPPPGATVVTAPKPRYDQLLDNWFGPLPGPNFYPSAKAPTWFAKTPENQMKMKDFFEPDLINAVTGKYNDWRETPRGRLALIILLDPVPRIIYDNKPQAFATDRMALGLVMEGMQRGDDLRLYPIERAFFYLPLMHSENPAMQNLSVAKYQQLVMETPEEIKPQILEFLTFARIHQNVIKKFGRFPYLNIINGRQSTPEELQYIKTWGFYPN